MSQLSDLEELEKILAKTTRGISISLFDKRLSEVQVVDTHEAREESKAIDSKHWDALPTEAQEALKKLGFYPITIINLE